MKPSRHQFLHVAAGAAALPAASRIARAEISPTRPVRLIASYPPGGGIDVGAGPMGQSLSERLDKPFVIDNRSGAGSNIGTEAVRADPDGYMPILAGGLTDPVARIPAGHMRAFAQPIIIENVSGAGGSTGVDRAARATPETLGLGLWNTRVAHLALYALPFDVLKGFKPISLLVTFTYVIVGSNRTGSKDFQALIAWHMANPEKVSQGCAGVGSGAHLAGILFQKLTGPSFQHVPYRGRGRCDAGFRGRSTRSMTHLSPPADIDLAK